MQRRLDELGEGIEAARRQAEADDLLPEGERRRDRRAADRPRRVPPRRRAARDAGRRRRLRVRRLTRPRSRPAAVRIGARSPVAGRCAAARSRSPWWPGRSSSGPPASATSGATPTSTRATRSGRTGLALSFTAAGRRRGWWPSGAGPNRARLVAVGALAAWSTAVWVVRDARILVADHEVGFKVVHTVLAVVSIVLAVAGLARGPPGQRRRGRPVRADAERRADGLTRRLSGRRRRRPRQHRVEGQGQAAAAAAGLEELVDRALDHVEAPRLELAADPRRRRRHDHGAVDHHRVGAERQRLVVGQHERLGHQRLDHLAAVAVPAERGDDGPAVVERAEREVEVVQPLVDQLDRAAPGSPAAATARWRAGRRTGTSSPTAARSGRPRA